MRMSMSGRTRDDHDSGVLRSTPVRRGARGRLVVPALLAVTSLFVGHACGGKDDEQSEPPFCEDLVDMTTCDTRVGCLWDADTGACVYECLPHADQASCEADEACDWLDDECVHGSL
jgi:hypothetical protein